MRSILENKTDDMRMSHSLKKGWYPILAVGLTMVSFIMIKTGRDAVFFQEGGLRKLPLAYIWIAVASVPAAILHLGALERWGARKTRTALFFLTTLFFVPFVPFADASHPTAMTILFVFVPTIFAAVFAGAWLLASDLLEGADGKVLRTVYTRIGAASMVGGIIGGLLSKAGAVVAGPRYLIAGGAALLVATGILVFFAHRKNPVDNGAPGPDPEADAAAADIGSKQLVLLRQGYTRVLIGISALATIAALYIDFQFYATATITGNSSVQFFANFYIILNLASLVVQLFVAPRLQAHLGVVGALLLLPAALLGGAGLFSFWSIVQGRTVLRILEGGLKASIYRSMWEQVYLPINRKFRDLAKTIVDGSVQRLAEGVGSLALLIWLNSTSAPLAELDYGWITWVIIAAIILWMLLTRLLGRLGCSDVKPTEPFIRLPDG